MSTPESLDTLRKLAEQTERTCAERVGLRLAGHSDSVRKLEMLEAYRLEYDGRLRGAVAAPTDAQRVSAWHSFSTGLDRAIEAQQQICAADRAVLEAARTEWERARQALKALDILSARRRATAQRAQARIEQKGQDEFAARASRAARTAP